MPYIDDPSIPAWMRYRPPGDPLAAQRPLQPWQQNPVPQSRAKSLRWTDILPNERPPQPWQQNPVPQSRAKSMTLADMLRAGGNVLRDTRDYWFGGQPQTAPVVQPPAAVPATPASVAGNPTGGGGLANMPFTVDGVPVNPQQPVAQIPPMVAGGQAPVAARPPNSPLPQAAEGAVTQPPSGGPSDADIYAEIAGLNAQLAGLGTLDERIGDMGQQRALAEQLRGARLRDARSNGRVTVAAHPLEALATVFQNYTGGKMQREQDAEIRKIRDKQDTARTDIMKAYEEILRGKRKGKGGTPSLGVDRPEWV